MLMKIMARFFLLTAVFLVTACTSDNEHFCVRYEYVYLQLNDPELPSYNELKYDLETIIAKAKDDSDHEKLMLFVLNDFHYGIKPDHEDPKSFWMRKERWNSYR